MLRRSVAFLEFPLFAKTAPRRRADVPREQVGRIRWEEFLRKETVRTRDFAVDRSAYVRPLWRVPGKLRR
jgi:hypothetical protein